MWELNIDSITGTFTEFRNVVINVFRGFCQKRGNKWYAVKNLEMGTVKVVFVAIKQNRVCLDLSI